MKNVVVKIDAKGNVRFLYDDSIREMVSNLGTMEMRRASQIRWNEVTQMWDLFVVDEDGTERFHSDFFNRGEAIDFEIDMLPKLLES